MSSAWYLTDLALRLWILTFMPLLMKQTKTIELLQIMT